ncbi:ribose-phosphate diphosphokinase [Nanoarchaeota archaeon]
MAKIKLISGSANEELAKDVASSLKTKLIKTKIAKFKDGEIYVRIEETVRGQHVFVVQPVSPKVNDHLMELLITIDALKRASAEKITAVVPYYPYARQDRKTKSREPITAKLVANLITKAGADRVLTIDLHSSQIQGFFDIPADNLTATGLFAEYFKKKKLKDFTVVSPDVGGTKRARKLANLLGCPIAIIDKRRDKPNEVAKMNIVGDVKGKNAIILDDIIDTGGTITLASEVLKKEGAKDVYLAVTHGLFSDPAQQRLQKSIAKEIVITNTIPLPKNKKIPKIKIISVANLIAQAIKNIEEHKSLQKLFEYS